MQNFIVLGIIPGTDYQTSLTFWLIISALILSLIFLPQLYFGLEQLRRYLTIRKIARTINHFDLVSI